MGLYPLHVQLHRAQERGGGREEGKGEEKERGGEGKGEKGEEGRRERGKERGEEREGKGERGREGRSTRCLTNAVFPGQTIQSSCQIEFSTHNGREKSVLEQVIISYYLGVLMACQQIINIVSLGGEI